MALYVVSYSDPECYSPTYMEGPEVENWEEYCKSLMDEIVAKAIQLCSKGKIDIYKHKNNWNNIIRENDLCDATIKVLESKGYKKIKLPNMDFNWQDDWRENTRIVAHNMKAEIEHDKEYMKEIKQEKKKKDPGYPGDDHLKYFKDKINQAREELAKFIKEHPEISKK